MTAVFDPSSGALRASEERHRLLLDSLNLGIQETDREGVITYSNRAHHEILGYPHGELLGKHIWALQPSTTERDAMRDHLGRLVEEQPAPLPFLTRNQRRDGTVVDLQIDWSYRRNDDGHLLGFLSVITDVTDHRETKEALLGRSRGLAILLEVSARLTATLELQPVLQATVDGVAKLSGLDTAAIYLREDQRLMLWAATPPLPPQFPDALRYTPLEDHPHLRRTIAEARHLLVPDISAVTLTPAERAVVAMRDLRTVLYLPLITDREVLGALIVGSTALPVALLDADIDLCITLTNLSAMAVRNAELFDSRRRYVAQLERNLAERKAAEKERAALQERLARTQKFETIGQLAGGVAHDFNNMLTAILANVDLALEEVDPGGKVHAGLLEIQNAAERSARLTKQLLAFAGAQPTRLRVLNLNETIGDLLTMLRRLISEDIALDWWPGEALWPVLLDPSQVDQVLVNLCVNARDAIVGRGRIVIETANVAREDAVRDACFTEQLDFIPQDYVTLIVSDDGEGMDDATAGRIFEPFFTTKTLGRGTGLGLATVYGIVKQNDGLIHVQSTPGGGATFRVWLPRHAGPSVTATTRQPPKGRPGGHELLLLVEDEPMLLALSRRILESLGYQVLATASPHDALRLAAEHHGDIQLLVTDVVLPGMNGRDLAEAIQARQPGLRVLFMSGYPADIITRQGVLDDDVHFLPKPFTAEALSSKVREVLGR